MKAAARASGTKTGKANGSRHNNTLCLRELVLRIHSSRLTSPGEPQGFTFEDHGLDRAMSHADVETPSWSLSLAGCRLLPGVTLCGSAAHTSKLCSNCRASRPEEKKWTRPCTIALLLWLCLPAPTTLSKVESMPLGFRCVLVKGKQLPPHTCPLARVRAASRVEMMREILKKRPDSS